MLAKSPQEEARRNRKLSHPWHGPYCIVERRDPDVTVVKVYVPQDGQIQVHQSRVSPCPPGFPAGFFWYGGKRSNPGRPCKWVDKLLQDATQAKDLVQDPPLSDFDMLPAASELDENNPSKEDVPDAFPDNAEDSTTTKITPVAEMPSIPERKQTRYRLRNQSKVIVPSHLMFLSLG